MVINGSICTAKWSKTVLEFPFPYLCFVLSSPRKIDFVSGAESEGHDDNVPLAPQKVSSKSAKWKTIAGLAFIDS